MVQIQKKMEQRKHTLNYTVHHTAPHLSLSHPNQIRVGVGVITFEEEDEQAPIREEEAQRDQGVVLPGLKKWKSKNSLNRTPSFSFAFKSQFGVGVIVIEEEEVIIVREVDHCCCHRRRRFCLKKSIVVAVVVTPFHSECKTS